MYHFFNGKKPAFCLCLQLVIFEEYSWRRDLLEHLIIKKYLSVCSWSGEMCPPGDRRHPHSHVPRTTCTTYMTTPQPPTSPTGIKILAVTSRGPHWGGRTPDERCFGITPSYPHPKSLPRTARYTRVGITTHSYWNHGTINHWMHKGLRLRLSLDIITTLIHYWSER